MAEPGEPLSERELEVIQCLARGATNKDIAADLTISENTVKVHLRNIYTKLEVSSRTEATTAALQQGYIAIPGQTETGDHTSNGKPDGRAGDAAALSPPKAVGPSAQRAASEAHAGEPARRLRWPIFAAVAAIGAVLLAIYVGQQLLTSSQPSASSTPFEETSIGNTRWLQSLPMPDARANMAVGAVGLDLYRIGGETAAGVDGSVHAFNSLDRQWRAVSNKPTAVADVSAAELYGELYVAGGRLPDGQPTSTVEAYSPTQDAWRPVASLPHPVSGGLTISDGSFLYVVGGHDGVSFLDTAYVYDPAGDSWRPLPPLPQERAAATGATLTGKLIVVGGYNESGALSSCLQFDLAEEAWTDCPPMLLPRRGAGSAVLLNRLYVIGGAGEEEEVSFSEMYDPTSETWQVINTPMLVEAPGWPGLGVGQIETRIYALGGREGETFLDRNYVFAPLVYQTYIPAASSADED